MKGGIKAYAKTFLAAGAAYISTNLIEFSTFIKLADEFNLLDDVEKRDSKIKAFIFTVAIVAFIVFCVNFSIIYSNAFDFFYPVTFT